MGKPSDHPGFRELLAEWNQKLAESGFKDCETSGGTTLKMSGTLRRYQTLAPTVREAKTWFFHCVSVQFSKTRFNTELEEKILYLYTQGMSQREIQERLQIPGHRSKVYKPIYYWLRKWGLKT